MGVSAVSWHDLCVHSLLFSPEGNSNWPSREGSSFFPPLTCRSSEVLRAGWRVQGPQTWVFINSLQPSVYMVEGQVSGELHSCSEMRSCSSRSN